MFDQSYEYSIQKYIASWNLESSRKATILSLTLETVNPSVDGYLIKSRVFSFADLQNSARLARSMNFASSKEASLIGRSLSSMGNLI